MYARLKQFVTPDKRIFCGHGLGATSPR